MDWTGGARKRFTAKNNALVQKQKAHFASVRAAMLSQRTPQQGYSLDSRSDSANQRTVQNVPGAAPSRADRQHAQRLQYLSEGTARDGGPYRSHVSAMPPAPRKGGSAYVTSDISSSPYRSSTSGRERLRDSARRRPQWPRSATRMTDQEEVLLAKRGKLLARSDWLGLSVAQPVRMTFPASRDKDRIGKRRKIGKAGSHKAKPAAQRLLTPLFEDRHFRGAQDYFMHGALQGDGSIRIKIGTDALASQTQRSQLSHTPGRTSVRVPSTEFGPLSEESMLLGADGDTFEAETGLVTDAHRHKSYTPSLGCAPESLRALAGSEVSGDMDGQGEAPVLPAVPARQSFQQNAFPEQYDGLEDLKQPSASLAPGSNRTIPDLEPRNEYGGLKWDFRVQQEHTPHRVLQSTSALRPMTATTNTGYHHEAAEYVSHPMSNEVANAISQENKSWMRMLSIPSHHSSKASVAAIRSSSQHNTTSESYHQSVLLGFRGQIDAEVATISTPSGAGTQDFEPLCQHIREQKFSPSEEDTAIQSPSASLKQIIRLTQRPAQVSQAQEEEEADNASWRQFIIGSQVSEEDSLRLLRQPSQDGEELTETDDASALAISGLGTSDKATAGDTPSLVGTTHSAKDKLRRQREIELTSAALPAQEVPDHDAPSHSFGSIDGENTIEELQPRDERAERPANIHARDVAMPGRRCCKRKHTAPASRTARRLQRSGKSRAGRDEQSVYDLVDSDGVSLY